jgi:hypothetical protein
LRRRLGAALAVLAAGLALSIAVPVSAATSWWSPAPGGRLHLTAIASNSLPTTLVIMAGQSYWLETQTGRLIGSGDEGRARFVAAAGQRGLVLNSDRDLYYLRERQPAQLLQRLPGEPLGLVVAAGSNPQVLAATTSGLFWGRLGDRLRELPGSGLLGPALALAAPVAAGQPFAIATRAGISLLGRGGRLRRSPGAPRLGLHPAVAVMGDGIILAGDQSGLIYAHYTSGWTPVFQLLPYGGLGGVPRLTAILGVGPQAAYIATWGFGTLLTPDGGYSWYRAAPPTAGGRVVALAALGPVYARSPAGMVAAAGPGRLFLHRLQTLPAPPSYSGASQTAQLLATAAVTVAAALGVILAMWWVGRRKRRFV